MKIGRLAALMRHFLPACHGRGDEVWQLDSELVQKPGTHLERFFRRTSFVVSRYHFSSSPACDSLSLPLCLLFHPLSPLVSFAAAFFVLSSPFLHNRYNVVSALA